jgi:NADPH2:quinone reductase
MKAAYIEATGGPEVIRYGDLPRPSPGEGQVLVRVGAASLNPIDLYIRSGVVKMPLPKPFIPGCDLAGTVEVVGPGVKNYRPGDRVWGSNQGLQGRQGTLAEYVCAGEEWLYPTPAGVSDAEASASALTGITAHLGLFQCGHLQSGEILFVNGGTGGVGSMVAQMAKAAGAQVITTVGSPEKAELCRSWGIDHVLNYKSEDVLAAVQRIVGERGVNVWYETQREPDFLKTVPAMARRGRIVIIAGRQAQPVFPVGPFYVKDLSLHGFAMFNATAQEQRRSADDINRLLAEKKLHVVIGRTFPLAEAAAAHKLLEDNTLHRAGTLMGKVVVVP